jgi:hypothetical protein
MLLEGVLPLLRILDSSNDSAFYGLKSVDGILAVGSFLSSI